MTPRRTCSATRPTARSGAPSCSPATSGAGTSPEPRSAREGCRCCSRGLLSLADALDVGRPEEPSAGTGTVMRPATLRGYALDAGFADVAILPIEQETFRFYRLIP